MADVQSIVDGTISKHPITIYSKTYCPYCKQTKELFDSLDLSGDLKPFYIELDEAENGAEQQDYLQEKTGQRTVPSVFINEKHVGGNSDVQALNSSGELQKLIGIN